MNSLTASSGSALDSAAWGAPLSAEELDSTTGGAIPILGWVVGVLALSVVAGAVDRILFGGCTCR